MNDVKRDDWMIRLFCAIDSRGETKECLSRTQHCDLTKRINTSLSIHSADRSSLNFVDWRLTTEGCESASEWKLTTHREHNCYCCCWAHWELICYKIIIIIIVARLDFLYTPKKYIIFPFHFNYLCLLTYTALGSTNDMTLYSLCKLNLFFYFSLHFFV